QGALVIINQIHPILVRFAVPERSLPDIQRYRKNRLPVLVSPSKEDTTFASGWLTFVDNSVDTTTGTVLLKAEFANRDGVLWPGEFLSVRLQLYVEEQAVVVPARSEEHTSELQSRGHLVCRLLLEKKNEQ